MKPTDDRRRCELLVKLGEVQRRAGDLHQAMATFRQAAAAARDDWRIPNFWPTRPSASKTPSSPAGCHAASVEDTSILLRGGIRPLAEADGPYAPECWPPCHGHSTSRARGIVARRSASRPLPSLDEQAIPQRWPTPSACAASPSGDPIAEERLAVADELYPAGRRDRRPRVGLDGPRVAAVRRVRAGRHAGGNPRDRSVRALAEALRQPQGLSDVAAWRATLALMDGRLEEAERLAHEALAIGQRAQSQNAVVDFTVQMSEPGGNNGDSTISGARVGHPQLCQQYPLVPSASLLALLACDLRPRRPEAYSTRLPSTTSRISPNWLWLPIMTMLSETSVALGDTPAQRSCTSLLLPYADRNVTGQHGDRLLRVRVLLLGRLATLMSRWEDAARHFADALVMNERMGLKPWVAHTLRAYAHLLISRPHRAAGPRASAGDVGASGGDLHRHERGTRQAQAIELLTDRRLAADRRPRPILIG